MSKVAVVQAPPVLLDRKGTIEGAVEQIAAVASEGAELVVFPEAYLPGYPTWTWRLRPGGDAKLTSELHTRLIENAVDLRRGDLAPILEAARDADVVVGIGLNEIDGDFARSTLYNTYVLIGPDGSLLNRHRKLMPTNPERMVWGMWDADGLRVVDTPVGRIGCLICWENFMPLARYALYAAGVEILLAPTWDSGSGWVGSMQHIAREGRCWVVSTATALHASDIPDDFPSRDQVFPDPDEWINPGDAVVVRPGGELVAGPHHRERSVLFADIDHKTVGPARRNLDVAGHYARNDVFQLTVNRGARPPVTWED
ncbi:MAG: carbon-nitrogen hydrolase family protein [Deltaproteobacteria bacterium]|nr:carbon-nitrogen hydrolase family protein [Deltaproteobacteria bacterium]